MPATDVWQPARAPAASVGATYPPSLSGARGVVSRDRARACFRPPDEAFQIDNYFVIRGAIRRARRAQAVLTRNSQMASMMRTLLGRGRAGSSCLGKWGTCMWRPICLQSASRSLRLLPYAPDGPRTPPNQRAVCTGNIPCVT